MKSKARNPKFERIPKPEARSQRLRRRHGLRFFGFQISDFFHRQFHNSVAADVSRLKLVEKRKNERTHVRCYSSRDLQ